MCKAPRKHRHSLKLLKIQPTRRIGCWPVTCISDSMRRVPTRSAPSTEWEEEVHSPGWHRSFPPASEREARMDHPMIRSRLGRVNGARLLGGSRSPNGTPIFSCRWILIRFDSDIPRKHVRNKAIRESVFCVENANHFVRLNNE
jgi:hypothetical protein